MYVIKVFQICLCFKLVTVECWQYKMQSSAHKFSLGMQSISYAYFSNGRKTEVWRRMRAFQKHYWRKNIILIDEARFFCSYHVNINYQFKTMVKHFQQGVYEYKRNNSWEDLKFKTSVLTRSVILYTKNNFSLHSMNNYTIV